MAAADVFPSNPWTDGDVARHWDKAAPIYVDANKTVSDAHDQRFLWAMPELHLAPGCRVLNIVSRDCGAHPFLTKACPSADLTHAEVSNGLIEVARKLHPEARIVKLDRTDTLPFEDGAFDRILTLETLEHVPSPQAFLSELWRITAPKGRMVLSCPPARSEFPYRVYTALFGGHGEGPHRFPPSVEVKARLAAAKWRLLRHEGTVLFPCGPAFLRRWGESLIRKHPDSWLSEWGIRQFFVCDRMD